MKRRPASLEIRKTFLEMEGVAPRHPCVVEFCANVQAIMQLCIQITTLKNDYKRVNQSMSVTSNTCNIL